MESDRFDAAFARNKRYALGRAARRARTLQRRLRVGHHAEEWSAARTDYDVEPISPMRGLYACVTRELPDGGPKGGWQPQEKISLEDCIRAYTSGSAYAEFEEGKKGELKEGEYADFIVLANDLTKVPPAEYLKTQVVRTVVGGRVVYEKK